MSRRPIPFPADDVSRLRRLLGLIEGVTTDEERVAYVPPTEPAPPTDRFAGRRAWAWFMDREARRGPDGRLRRRRKGDPA